MAIKFYKKSAIFEADNIKVNRTKKQNFKQVNNQHKQITKLLLKFNQNKVYCPKEKHPSKDRIIDSTQINLQ